MRFHSFHVIRKSATRSLAHSRPLLQWMSLLILWMISGLTDSLQAQRAPEVDNRFRQAWERMRKGNRDEAAEAFAAIVKEAPPFAEAHFNLGLVREEKGSHSEAIASFERALSLKPRLRGANLFSGIAEFRINHLDRAVAAVKKETVNYPSDASAWLGLGCIPWAQEPPIEAAEALDKAAMLAPDDLDILYHRGRAHLLVSK